MQIIVSFQLSLEDGKRHMNRKFQKFLISTTAKMNLLYEKNHEVHSIKFQCIFNKASLLQNKLKQHTGNWWS